MIFRLKYGPTFIRFFGTEGVLPSLTLSDSAEEQVHYDQQCRSCHLREGAPG